MYKTGHAFTYLLLKENVAYDVINVSLFGPEPVWTSLFWTTLWTNWGLVCRPVATLKADILNITFDCYSQNNNVKMATL